MTIVLLALLSPVAGAATPSGHMQEEIVFQSAETVAAQGDIATIDIGVPSGSTTLITISGATTDYTVQMALVDQNYDGKIAIRMNTHLAGQLNDPSEVYTAAGVDHLNYVNRIGSYRSEHLQRGRYNIIAANSDSSIASTLRLVNGSVYGSELHVANAQSSNSTTITPVRGQEIVKGDVAVARFHVRGIGALVGDRQSADVVIPADSAPGVSTTHTIAVSPSKNASVRTVTIDYGAGDGGIPQSVLAGSLSSGTVVGIDSNSDGIIDHRSELNSSDIDISTTMDGNVTLSFSETPQLTASETLYLRLPIKNPSTEGSDRVRLTLNGHLMSTASEIRYGPAGAGSLGYGVDFQIHAQNSTVVNPVAGIDYQYKQSTNTLVVRLPTDGLKYGQEYGLGLQLSREYPYGNVSGDRVTFIVAKPQARLQQPQNGTVPRDGAQQFHVVATTNLAPKHEVGIEIVAANGSGGTIFTKVTPRQRITQTVTPPRQIDSQNLTVSISYNSQVISDSDSPAGEPQAYRIRRASY